jgi:hypothetical protein
MTHSSYRKSSFLTFSLKLTWSWTVTLFSKTSLAARVSRPISFPEKAFSATPSESSKSCESSSASESPKSSSASESLKSSESSSASGSSESSKPTPFLPEQTSAL